MRSRLTAGEEFVRFFEGSMNQGLFVDWEPQVKTVKQRALMAEILDKGADQKKKGPCEEHGQRVGGNYRWGP